MSVVDQVKQVLDRAVQVLPGAEVAGPFGVYGATGMGMQIKLPQTRGAQKCEVVASFVIPHAELSDEAAIHARANAAIVAIQLDVQVIIRPIEQDAA